MTQIKSIVGLIGQNCGTSGFVQTGKGGDVNDSETNIRIMQKTLSKAPDTKEVVVYRI